MDIVSAEKRRANMQAIRSKNTRPELYIRKLLHGAGVRYSIAPGKIPGHPDLYSRRFNTAVFVHGCFWHRHQGCSQAYMPKSRVEFWQAKFDRNVARDREVRVQLKERGIRCLIIWECTIKKAMRSEELERKLLDSMMTFLKGDCDSSKSDGQALHGHSRVSEADSMGRKGDSAASKVTEGCPSRNRGQPRGGDTGPDCAAMLEL